MYKQYKEIIKLGNKKISTKCSIFQIDDNKLIVFDKNVLEWPICYMLIELKNKEIIFNDCSDFNINIIEDIIHVDSNNIDRCVDNDYKSFFYDNKRIIIPDDWSFIVLENNEVRILDYYNRVVATLGDEVGLSFACKFNETNFIVSKLGREIKLLK